MQTLEFGYKGPIGKKTYMAADIYISQFNDFFSPATIITPLVKLRSTGQTVGMLPANTYGSNPPYGTGWDGQDNDNDWSSDTQTAFSNWDNNWKFIETEGGTKISFDIDFEIENKFLNVLMSKSFEFGLNKIADAFQKRAEDLYRPIDN